MKVFHFHAAIINSAALFGNTLYKLLRFDCRSVCLPFEVYLLVFVLTVGANTTRHCHHHLWYRHHHGRIRIIVVMLVPAMFGCTS